MKLFACYCKITLVTAKLADWDSCPLLDEPVTCVDATCTQKCPHGTVPSGSRRTRCRWNRQKGFRWGRVSFCTRFNSLLNHPFSKLVRALAVNHLSFAKIRVWLQLRPIQHAWRSTVRITNWSMAIKVYCWSVYVHEWTACANVRGEKMIPSCQLCANFHVVQVNFLDFRWRGVRVCFKFS